MLGVGNNDLVTAGRQSSVLQRSHRPSSLRDNRPTTISSRHLLHNGYLRKSKGVTFGDHNPDFPGVEVFKNSERKWVGEGAAIFTALGSFLPIFVVISQRSRR